MNTTDFSPVQDYKADPHIDQGTKAFLKILNSGGVPLETLSKVRYPERTN